MFGTTYVVNASAALGTIALGAIGFEIARGANERAKIRTYSEMARQVGLAVAVYNGELEKFVAAEAAIAATKKT